MCDLKIISATIKKIVLFQRIKLRDLHNLRKLYHKAYKLSKKINYIFSSRNLLLVLHHCALGTIYLYWAIRHSLPGVTISMTKLLNMYRASIMSFVSIMWLIWPSTIAVAEVKRTAVLVHQLLSTTRCPDFENEVGPLRKILI